MSEQASKRQTINTPHHITALTTHHITALTTHGSLDKIFSRNSLLVLCPPNFLKNNQILEIG